MAKNEKHKVIGEFVQILCSEQIIKPNQVEKLFDQFQEIYKDIYYRGASEILAAIREYSQNNGNKVLKEENYIILAQNLRSLTKKARIENKEFLGKLEELYELCNGELQRLMCLGEQTALEYRIKLKSEPKPTRKQLITNDHARNLENTLDIAYSYG